ncbi:ABC-F family ATP-binding cassette domain-containing protein [Amorphus orientalis]|uniref:ATP-binding cassette subfamily F protein 3 n=1 Tax=Amorphus orientalis TaxID=649198 RepID=A0AAE3VP50_9HYPH|nr:ABC-F family ATP-binding cassette domain-containing protein [Amorphus orientalis]MDQ0315631.1 ATP-binding cassette subfamily F protein 3 [Amorphus orientalis]
MLTVTDLTYRIAGRTLFDGASASFPARAKVGFVGRNGTGKTTLFKLIQGDLSPESGDIRLPKGTRIGAVAQEAPASDATLTEWVLAADTERASLLAEAETATDPARIAEIHVRLSDIDAHSAEARAARILSGLGFSTAAQARPCHEFSGGWRMRVALAAVLFSAPDLLLLDEPTNYLDLEGTIWLESYLARYPHTVLLISHDRDLLNGAVDRILHLDQGKLTLYSGGYNSFARQRAEQAMLQEKRIAKQEAERKHLQAFVDRFRAKASKARQAQSRLKKLEKMETIAPVVDDQVLPIRLADPPGRLSPPIVTMEGVSVGYEPGKPILSGLTLRIDDDDRIALLGSNGNGKSTFAKLIARRLKAETGRIVAADKLTVAYFAQHQLDELVGSETPVDHVRRRLPGVPEAKVRARVANFGLAGSRMDTPADTLSGGERARLLLGLATFEGPHLLILDEPTNHLDIDSRQALMEAINDYAGAVLLISHDPYLIEACADRLWLVGNGTVAPFDGDLDDYRSMLLRTDADTTPRDGGDDRARGSAQDRRRAAAQARAELAPLKKKITAAERKLEAQQTRLATLDAALADPKLFSKDPGKGASLAKERADTAAEIAKLEEDWITLSAEYEEALSVD